MQYYFLLQFRMFNRRLTDFGVHPVAGYLVICIAFFGFGHFLFLKTEAAATLFVIVALSLVSRLNETARIRFLKSIFSKADFLKVRLAENILLVFPFIVYLLARGEWLHSFILIFLAVFVIWLGLGTAWGFTIPTPFYKIPYEFAVGFRSTILLILAAYFLTFMAVWAANFNLGVFALVLVMLITMSFYFADDEIFLVWIFAKSPKQFLMHKLKTGLMYSTLLQLMPAIFLLVFFPTQPLVILLCIALGSVGVFVVILAKYSVFPSAINVPQLILIGLCVTFPPIMLVVVPFFYVKSVKKLNEILK